MKQDYGMFFFACLLNECQTTTVSDYAPFFAELLFPNFPSDLSCFGVGYVSKNIQFVISISSMHHTMRPYYIVLYQFQLICLFSCLDRLQHHNMKWCWQCTSLFFHHLLQLLMVCILRVYIAQKNERGEKQYVP